MLKIKSLDRDQVCCCLSTHHVCRFFISLHQKAKHLLLLLLSFRVPMLRYAWHGIRFDHRQPDHCIVPHRPELGTRERPPADKQDRLDPVAPATALYQWMATGGSWWGEVGEGVDHPGRETPREQGLHEEVSPWLQQQWLWLENGVWHQWEQAKGKSFLCFFVGHIK